MKKVVIIDYKLGNINSVANAFNFLGCNTAVSCRKEDIEDADYIVLPGVGAFAEGMKNLENLGLIDVLNKQVLENKKPILGICLGFQLFAKESEENGLFKGLGWVNSRVEKLRVNGLRMPHIGWNDIKIKKDSFLLKDIPDNNFYFVHSYAYQSGVDDIATSVCNYGVDFVASIQKGNIFGTQFHPEKSHISGLKLLKNFINFNGDG